MSENSCYVTVGWWPTSQFTEGIIATKNISIYDKCSVWTDSPPLTESLWVKGQCRLFLGTQDKQQPEPEVEEESLSVSVVTQPPPQSCYPFTSARCSSSSANNSHLLTFFFNFKTAGLGWREPVSKNAKTKSSQDSKMSHSRGTKSLFFSECNMTSGICARGSQRQFYFHIFFWTPDRRTFLFL